MLFGGVRCWVLLRCALMGVMCVCFVLGCVVVVGVDLIVVCCLVHCVLIVLVWLMFAMLSCFNMLCVL